MKESIKVFFRDLYEIFVFLAKSIKHVGRKRYKFDKKIRDKVLIIGNGPSYKQFPFEKLKENIDFVCVNWFPVKDKEAFFSLKPQYLCIVDPYFFDTCGKDMLEYLECLKKINWPINIICGEKQVFSINNEYIRYIRISNICYEGSLFKNYIYSHNMATFGTFNVMHAALFAVINMNYKKIYMTGVDFNEIVNITINENNEFITSFTHGYEATQTVNLSKEENLEKGHLYRFLYMNYRGFASFLKAEEYANYKGSKIYNLVLNSYIDAFEKAKPEDLIEERI